MKWFVKYLLTTLPPLLFYGAWQLSIWAYSYYECQGNIKSLQSCLVGGYDIVPIIGFGLFWCSILWYPAIVVSGYLMIRIYRRQMDLDKNNKLS